jgi:four helix bundle suffix protein
MSYRTYMSYPDGFIPPHGNYRQLLSYRKAEIVFDITYRFCQRFLAKSDRTIDQMIQGGRSGKQNILEGSKASGTSKETEIKLMGVARASLEELLGDYRDALRVRGMRTWEKESCEARFVRHLGSDPQDTFERYRNFCDTRPLEVVANIAICLINQANYLLDRQVRRLERDFIREGGIRERMRRARKRRKSDTKDTWFSLASRRSPSTLRASFLHAPLAQLAEQVTLNHWVVGSIPTRCKVLT